MTQTEKFDYLVKYLAKKGCKFLVKEDYINNKVVFVDTTWYKEGKFYKVNNVVVAKNILPIINDFIPLR